MKNIYIIFTLFGTLVYAGDSYYYNGMQRVKLTPISSLSRSVSGVDFYETEKGIVLGVSDTLILKLKNSVNLDAYLLEVNATLQKTLGTDLYLLKVQDKTLTLSVANRLNEKEDVEYAHPDFLKRRVQR